MSSLRWKLNKWNTGYDVNLVQSDASILLCKITKDSTEFWKQKPPSFSLFSVECFRSVKSFFLLLLLAVLASPMRQLWNICLWCSTYHLTAIGICTSTAVLCCMTSGLSAQYRRKQVWTMYTWLLWRRTSRDWEWLQEMHVPSWHT